MCSLFVPSTRIMENYQGDLTDILRAGAAAAAATGGPYGCSGGAEVADHNQDPNINATVDWLHFPSDHSMKFSSPSAMEEEEPRDNFGDPFCSYMRDPLLHELDLSGSVSTGFFSGPISSQMTNISAHHHHVDEVVTSTTSAAAFAFGPHQVDQISKRPCNIFSPMLQISPSGGAAVVSPCDSPVMGAAASPRGVNKGSLSAAAAAMLPSDMINGNSSKGCLLDNTGGGMQISSPRNPGIKRRKSQAKKVVCIPAPAAANSRPTGEVVPSDLWAWRKYGQKPIKGSPYPRGYYRCSSSKGCSARKQVERSRTDPNMLVITYTSEHNHPWPTQRNALAGSTRSQPSKSSAASKTSPSHHSQPQQKTSSPKEEQRGESMNEHNGMSSTSSTTVSASHVKEEVEDIEKQLEVHHHDHHHDHSDHHHQFMSTDHHHDQGFPYRPSMPNDVDHDHHQCNSNINNHQSQSHHEDFFADLGELEADPLNLLFSQCFTADEQQQQKGGSKASEASALDPFSLFDWSEDNNNNTTTSFGDQAKRRL